MRIGITIIDMANWDYIAGIRIVSQDGIERMAGYGSHGTETMFDMKSLFGFRVTMGPQGVRALQLIGPEKQSSKWIGRIDGVPLSERLIMDRPIASLKASFDVSISCDFYICLCPLERNTLRERSGLIASAKGDTTTRKGSL